MSTRHTRSNDDYLAQQRIIDKALQDANIALDIPDDEKMQIYKALKASNEVSQVEHETQRLSLDSRSPTCQKKNDSQLNDDFQNASTSQDSLDIFEDVEGSSGPQDPQPIRSVLEENKQPAYLSTPVRHEENPRKVARQSQGSVGRNLPGRGRAIPKVKYSPLSIITPGQQNNTSNTRSLASALNTSSSQHQTLEPQGQGLSPYSIEDCPLSPQDVASAEEEIQSDTKQLNPTNAHSPENERSSTDQSSPLHADSCFEVARSEVGENSQGLLSPENRKNKVFDSNQQDNECEAVDVEADFLAEESSSKGSNSVDKAYSPASVEDALDEDEKESIEIKMVGNLRCPVSPLHSMTRGFQSYSSVKFFEELEKYKDDKEEYFARAREMARASRLAVLEKICRDNPIWSSPISDGGVCKQTLFKHSLPKYSKIVGNSSDKQGGAVIRTSERAAKVQAANKIHSIASEINSSESEFHGSRQRSKAKDEEWSEPEYHGLRQKSRQLKSQDLPEGKRAHQSNAWGSRKRPEMDSKDEVECLDASGQVGDSGHWQSERDQKKQLGDSDSETSPEPPSASGPGDPYEFPDYGDHEETEIFPSKQNRNKRNNKRGGQSLQGNHEVDVKSLPRPRGGQNQRGGGGGGRSTKLRLQNKSLGPPSEHATTANKYFRNRGGTTGHDDSEVVSQNNVNTENKWINMESKDTRNSNISSNQFYGNNKVMQPRTPLSSQSRKTSRDNQNDGGFPSSPNSSGSHLGLNHEVKDEEAAVATTACPICNKMFAAKDIVAHSSDCFEFSGNAEGEETPAMKGSMNSNRSVSEEIEDPGSPSECSREAVSSTQCKKCKVHLNLESMELHQEECDGVSSHTRLKRASSIDEDNGPAKKTSRRMN